MRLAAAADPFDLAVALGSDALAVAAVLLLELLDRLGLAARLAERGVVEDLAFGELRLVDPAQLGDSCALVVTELLLLCVLQEVPS